jgi:LAO/AO transport system kinase
MKARVQDLVERTRTGSIRAAGRLISLIQDYPERIPELLKGAGEWPHAEAIVGITGAPGVGKSTVVDALITEWRRSNPDSLIGVVAVDPSSVFTGGAVLGDRIRMMNHSTDPLVFIRSLANRGHFGGLTLGIRGTLRIMGLAGCRVILVETVGVGQNEVEVSEVADITVVLLAPGHGDSVQMIKAGLLETGDLFAINKADRPGADRLYSDLSATLKLTSPARHGLPPEIHSITATLGTGVRELKAAIERRLMQLQPLLREHRQRTLRDEVRQAILETARIGVEAALTADGILQSCIDRLLTGESSIRELACEVLRRAANTRAEPEGKKDDS